MGSSECPAAIHSLDPIRLTLEFIMNHQRNVLIAVMLAAAGGFAAEADNATLPKVTVTSLRRVFHNGACNTSGARTDRGWL
jgi:hypothetical protein